MKEYRKDFEGEEWIKLDWLREVSYEDFIEELHK